MGEEFAPLQCGLAPLHGFDKTVLFLEVTRHDILDGLVEVAALSGCSLRNAGFEVRGEMNFQALKIRETAALATRFDRPKIPSQNLINLCATCGRGRFG